MFPKCPVLLVLQAKPLEPRAWPNSRPYPEQVGLRGHRGSLHSSDDVLRESVDEGFPAIFQRMLSSVD
jgi:hypothetical protein